MSVKKDEVQVSVIVNGQQGVNELGKLEAAASDFRGTLKDTKKAAEDFAKANTRLAKSRLGWPSSATRCISCRRNTSRSPRPPNKPLLVAPSMWRPRSAWPRSRR